MRRVELENRRRTYCCRRNQDAQANGSRIHKPIWRDEQLWVGNYGTSVVRNVPRILCGYCGGVISDTVVSRFMAAYSQYRHNKWRKLSSYQKKKQRKEFLKPVDYDAAIDEMFSAFENQTFSNNPRGGYYRLIY